MAETRPTATPARRGRQALPFHRWPTRYRAQLSDLATPVAQPLDRNSSLSWTGTPVSVGHELQSQLDMLARADCTRVFSEKISTRVKERPELEKALTLAREIKAAAPNQPVILTVVEMKRLARSAAELMTLSSTLQADGIQLELLSGPLQGVYDPNGAGAIVFAVLAVSAEVEREGIREKTLEGLDAAARKGNIGGRPSVVDDDKLAVARARHAKGDSVTAIAKALGIGRATLYRHLGESA
ncbi:recombinase family protein [Streptomyces sp. NPDC056701]|uniref:recombinase family protein n=1 Tax=Streptomyces sp. NPDC056701 TaxID=3345916 RepID=UPI003678AA91